MVKDENAGGKEILDPTKNVLLVLNAAIQRIDDLQRSEMKRIEDKLTTHTEYTRQLASAESERINAIRAVDVRAGAIDRERAIAQAAVLANQVVASAETLRTLVATTASAMAQQTATVVNQLMERITLLERSKYEISGTRSGAKDTWGWILAAVMGLIALLSFVYPRIH